VADALAKEAQTTTIATNLLNARRIGWMWRENMVTPDVQRVQVLIKNPLAED